MMKGLYPLHYWILSRLNHGNLPHKLAYNPISRNLFVERKGQHFRDRKVIFSISSGRSGSGYLSNLLSLSPDVFARHEPRPRLNGRYLKMVMDQGLSETYEARLLKIFGINILLAMLPEKITYAETSHMFIKTYFDVVIDYFEMVEVIVLRRPLSKVLRSCIQLDYFSPETVHWREWMYIPRPDSCFSEAIATPNEMDKYDRCIAYLLDIEARAQSFIETNSTAGIHEIYLKDISTNEGARYLFGQLGCKPPLNLDVSTLKKNQLKDAKKFHGITVPIDYCLHRIDKYLQTAIKLGKALPDLSKIRI